jgi:alpha-ribazole phosphatase
MRLYLIRHPKPERAAGICYGSADLCVAQEEEARAASALAPLLPSGVPIYSSPLQRCSGFARRLAETLAGGAVIPDARLVELDFGSWEGRAWIDIARAEVEAWAADPVGYRPGAGENVMQAATRIHAFLASVRQCGHESVIVVCHAGPIRLLQASRGGVSPAKAAATAARVAQAPPYGSLTVLEL